MAEELKQGPKAGRLWPAETESYVDSETGATVRRLTGYPGSNNWHLYFTEPGWYDGGRRLLFTSDRDGGSRELYSINLETGLITQLTDLSGQMSGVTRCAAEPIAYFWSDRRMVSLDLDTLTVETLYERPEGYGGSVMAATVDGERVVTAISEEIDIERNDDDREAWIAERMSAGPDSQVLSVPTDGGEPTVHVRDNRWLNHVNASPTRPELVTYCEEGTWEEVDRIWGLNVETDETWQVRPTDEDEAVGHEYWLQDGEYVGYHGWHGDRDRPDAFFGQVRYDGTDRREGFAPDVYTHYHGNTRDLVVGDGTHRGAPYNLVYEWNEEIGEYEDPRKLASHDWQSDADTHPHSRIGPDDATVVFDSTRAGETSDIYLVEIPDDLTELPRFEGTDWE